MKRRLLGVALLALASPAFAGDGRIEIHQACVATGCFPGDAPGYPVQTSPGGNYVLTSNLGGVNTTGVHLEQGATLDLNGFAIEGSVTCTGAPAVCTSQGFNGGGINGQARSVIRNGTVRGINSYGIRVGPQTRVENMRIEQNAAGGIASIDTGAPGVLIQDCFVVQNGGAGIVLAIGDGALGARVLHNTIHGNAYAGVQGAISLLTDNAITKNGDVGAVLNYSGSTAGYKGNQFYDNNGGNENPQRTGGVSLGPNVCGGVLCP